MEVEEEKAQELLECVLIEHPEEKLLKKIENTETRNLVREMYLLTENDEKQKTVPEIWATLIAAMSVLVGIVPYSRIFAACRISSERTTWYNCALC